MKVPHLDRAKPEMYPQKGAVSFDGMQSRV